MLSKKLFMALVCWGWFFLLVGCGPDQKLGSLQSGLSLWNSAKLENQNPTVLLHGFFGWGRDEMLGWLHFGGFFDIQQYLTDLGYKTHTVAVGPISSSWDRAAELYAQLVGGTVDYGYAHAKRHRHKRLGRTYQALLPGLGKQNIDGTYNQVNVISHSMGSQTIRVLIAMLQHGDANERLACPNGQCPPDDDGVSRPLSPLFSGQSVQFVHAVASVSGANNGSSLAHLIDSEFNLNQLISILINLFDLLGGDLLYDFKLDHFGIGPRQPSESLPDYVRRVITRFVSNNSQDTAFFDLSFPGSKLINAWTPADENVYYFSWSNSSTYRGWLTGRHYPKLCTNPLLLPTTAIMGHAVFPTDSPTCAELWANDGIVNTYSMSGPILNSDDIVRPYHKKMIIESGTWHHMGTRQDCDHWDTLGLLDPFHGYRYAGDFFARVAALLQGEEWQ